MAEYPCYKKPLSKRDAETALNHAKAGGRGKRGKECRFYFCQQCDAYHLTKWKGYSSPTK